MEVIFRWLARLLAGILEKFGDPSLQSRLDAYNAKVAEVEAREKDAARQAALSEAAYRESVERRAEIDRLIVVSREEERTSRERLAAAQTRIEEIEHETKILNEGVAARSDDDAFSGVPKSAGNSPSQG